MRILSNSEDHYHRGDCDSLAIQCASLTLSLRNRVHPRTHGRWIGPSEALDRELH